MRSVVRSSRLQTAITAVLAVLATIAALVVAQPSAHAAPGPLKPLNLPGTCNSVSWSMAGAIDTQIAANGDKFRMIQTDQPKKGETGFVDGTVAYAMVQFAELLGKKVGELTDADFTNNPKLVTKAVNNALAYRKDTKKGDFTLTYQDAAGNNVYLWCLKAGNGHGGPDLGLLYVPANQQPAAGLWIAGCLLPGGMNVYGFSVDDKTANFVKFVWYNEGPDAANPGGFIRYTFEYDVAKNILMITKQTGKYKDGVFTPATTEAEKNPAAPPAQFKDLKLNGTPIALLPGGCACPARAVVVAVADPVIPNTLDLSNPPLDGSGTAGDPYVGISTTIDPGDTFIVTSPDGTVVVAGGSDPDWALVTPGFSTVLMQYDGVTPLTLGVGAVIPDVAVLSSASPSPSPTPTSGPSSGPTSSPSSSPTSSPSSGPTSSPTPPPTSPSFTPTASGE